MQGRAVEPKRGEEREPQNDGRCCLLRFYLALISVRKYLMRGQSTFLQKEGNPIEEERDAEDAQTE